MVTSRKVVELDQLVKVVRELQRVGCQVVFTNGCFDILHAGHIRYLQQARGLGDILIIALNSDESVRQLKGPTRPVIGQNERAFVLAALQWVDYIVIFETVRATRVIEALKPDIYAKGGDYTVETLDSGERAALEACGAEIRLLPLIEGFSTTNIIEQVRSTKAPDS